jgi:hypothetical protein
MVFSCKSVFASAVATFSVLVTLSASAETYREWYQTHLVFRSMAHERLCGQKKRTVDPRNENICNSGYQNRQAPSTANTRVERTYWTCNNAVLTGIREGLILERSLADGALTDCILRARENFNNCSRAVDSQMFGLGSKFPNYPEKIGRCEAKSLRNGWLEALRSFRNARLRIEDERAFSDCMKLDGLDACRKRWDDEEQEAMREFQSD